MRKYNPTPINFKGMDIDDIIKALSDNWEQLKKCNDEAKEKNTLVGRCLTHPYADGQAIYQIIRENKLTVKIHVCSELGDDWVLPAWGVECTIPKKTALIFILMEKNKVLRV